MNTFLIIEYAFRIQNSNHKIKPINEADLNSESRLDNSRRKYSS